MIAGLSLKCYSDREGLQWTRCDEQKGFLTCFTKYDQSKKQKYALTIQYYVSISGPPHGSIPSHFTIFYYTDCLDVKTI